MRLGRVQLRPPKAPRLKAAATKATQVRDISHMEIIDSHAHLEMTQFDDDRAAMLERARAAGVSQ